MAKEIERKFLVGGDFRPWVKESVHIVQGYLNSSPERTVRIRTWNDKGYITVKGMTGERGMSRYEWEKEIGIADAQELFLLCEPGTIDKQRHIIEAGKHVYEVDEFFGENSGLIVAEIELSCEDEDFEKPSWLGKEVTADARYYNSSLMKCPFSKWGK